MESYQEPYQQEPYQIVKSENTYKGKIVDVVVDTLMMPDGKQAYREVVLRGGASAVLPIDSDGNIIFVRQYRHPVRKHVLEIPAGMLDDGEDPYNTAMRELEEETGFKCDKLVFLTSMYSAIGFCTEVLHIYYTDTLKSGVQHFDADEFIEIERYSLEKSIEMVFNGEIQDSKTITAIFMYKACTKNPS